MKGDWWILYEGSRVAKKGKWLLGDRWLYVKERYVSSEGGRVCGYRKGDSSKVCLITGLSFKKR